METTGLAEPQNWGTKEEIELIDAYLIIRETYGKYPMTDAKKRGLVTKNYVDKGIISAARDSFKFAG